MPYTGPRTQTAFVDDASVGTVEWTEPGLPQVGLYTGNFLSPGLVSHYAKATAFGFALTNDSAVQGIYVEVFRSCSPTSTVIDNSVRIVKGGTIAGNEKATAVPWAPLQAGRYRTDVYGGNADLWGLSWTPSDINGATFGVVVSGTTTADDGFGGDIAIHHIQVRIYFALPEVSVF